MVTYSHYLTELTNRIILTFKLKLSDMVKQFSVRNGNEVCNFTGKLLLAMYKLSVNIISIYIARERPIGLTAWYLHQILAKNCLIQVEKIEK